jgi:hypothetical protein
MGQLISSKHLGLYGIFLGALILLLVHSPFVIAQEALPQGTVFNSKYLSIPEHGYKIGDFSNQITGTVVNNSTQEISGISVDAALYDNAGKFITMKGAEFADVSTLPPGDESAFSIRLFGMQDEVVYYSLFPGGTP